MLVEVSPDDARPLLLKLWPQDYNLIDNFHGRIFFKGNEYSEMRISFFVWRENGVDVGVTQCFTVGRGHLRLRATYVEPAFRSKGIARALVLGAISKFPECHTVFTFPRAGSERFYESLGFRIVSPARHSGENLHPYGYAEKRLIPQSI